MVWNHSHRSTTMLVFWNSESSQHMMEVPVFCDVRSTKNTHHHSRWHTLYHHYFKKSCLTYSYHRSKKLNFSSDKLFSFFSFYWWFRRMRNKKEIGLLEVFSERIEMQKVLSVLTLCMQVTWTFVIPNATQSSCHRITLAFPPKYSTNFN